MFNLSGTELVFIALLGLIVLGPEKLPGAMRKAGKIYREIRSISSNVQREVQKAMDEPIRQVKSMIDEPASELEKAAKDVNDVFGGKMPHLERRPAADAASAFAAASAGAAATEPAPDSTPIESPAADYTTADGTPNDTSGE